MGLVLDGTGWFEKDFSVVVVVVDVIVVIMKRKFTLNNPSCHDAGAACLAHATQHQLLLSAGKKGLVRNEC